MAAHRKPNKVDTRNIEHVLSMRIDATLRDLEFLISCTPTGDARNLFTDVNIYAMQTRDALNKARIAADKARYA